MSGKAAAAAAKSLQSCPILCDLIDGSPPGSSAHGILQARTLEWGAIAFSPCGYRIDKNLERRHSEQVSGDEILTVEVCSVCVLVPLDSAES